MIAPRNPFKPYNIETESSFSRLLSHSSGFCYDVLYPPLLQWRKHRNEPLQPEGPKIEDRFLYPLSSEPGTEWIYSPSIDWAGRLVERLNGNISLEEYMQQNIWGPLGISTMTFFLQKHPELLAKRADMTVRNETTGRLEHSEETYWHADPEDAFGGMALYSSPQDFMKVLSSLLMADGKLLSPEATREFSKPQLSDKARGSMTEFLSNERWNLLMGGNMPYGLKKDHALGGLLLAEDVPGGRWRKKGTMAWTGRPNVFWAGCTTFRDQNITGANDQ